MRRCDQREQPVILNPPVRTPLAPLRVRFVGANVDRVEKGVDTSGIDALGRPAVPEFAS